MVSSDLMKEFLDNMSTDSEILPVLCARLGRTEGNVRRVLREMQALNLVVQVEMSIPGRKFKYGWAKTILHRKA